MKSYVRISLTEWMDDGLKGYERYGQPLTTLSGNFTMKDIDKVRRNGLVVDWRPGLYVESRADGSTCWEDWVIVASRDEFWRAMAGVKVEAEHV